ncbi:bifunctional MaoC family dehydratase N-terminal/OB-fold nucleic acid binding domain-containing protein [Streptomyces decoyicus]|uniref:bifunctional MaoC family dehydratase N-terminal/OB-fold nucleic acid binding domain-containing protein n=1 Tax=Streptomyces decoyicus TaxID=249567 RepID=UPI00386565FB|nr:OB-fold domain-containing protein [Streptomyces decoyicus]
MSAVQLAYEQLKAYEGRSTSAACVGKDLVNEPMIRHWCEAVGDTNPAYRGPDAIAPPTMLQAWTMGGLSGHTDRSGAYDELSGLLDSAGYTSIVATDCEQEYLRPLRPGDRITFDAVIESVSERKTTKLGTGYFITTRMDIRADGEPAGTHRFRVLKYAPAARTPEAVARTPEAAARTPEAAARTPEAAERPQAPEQPKAPEQPRARRPRPVINRDNAGFWEGVAGHRLLIQRCTGCRTLRFPWLPGCNACGSAEWETVEASGVGTVFSYVVMHHPPFPAFTASEHGTAAPRPQANAPRPHAGAPGPAPDAPAPDAPAPDAPAPDAPAPDAPAPGTTAPDAPAPDGPTPYAVGLIQLAEGVRIVSNVIGVPYDKVRIGMPVRLEFLRVDEELELPVFRAAEGGEG